MKRLITSFVALAAVVSAFAQTPLPNDPAVRVGKLENGLTYYIRHNDKPAQRCEFYLATNAGAINEGPGQDGLAHFLEHMCFNGLKNLPGKQMLNYLQSIGASFGGNINASTGVETTQYMLNNIPVVREGIIDTCLLVMHDYSHFVLNHPEEIDAERGVILEEKRTRNNAQWRLFEQSMKYYYGDTKYATTNIIGSEENLKTFKPETLVDFYRTWYRPDKQAVIVVGDIDVDMIEAKIKKLFEDIPAAENPVEMEPIVIPGNKEPVVGVITDPELSANSISVLWKHQAVPEQFNNTDQVYLLNTVHTLVGLVMDERFGDISSKPGAPFNEAGLGYGNLVESCDALFADVDYKNGDDIAAFSSLMYEVEKLRRYGVTEAELQRAKDNLISARETAAEGADSRKNPSFIRPLLNNFFDNKPFLEPATALELTKAICSQLPAAAINQLIAQYITEENMVVVLSGSSLVEHPTEAQILEVISSVRNAEIEAPVAEVSNVQILDPAALKASKVKKSAETIAGATEWMLKNGVRVVVLPTEYKKDEVSIRLELPGGQSLINNDELYSFEDNIWAVYSANTGLASFTKRELDKALAGKMVSVAPWIDGAYHGISASSTPKDIETAFQLLYLNFMNPRFDADEFQVGIDQIKAVLPNMETNPMFQFQKRIPSTIYEANERCFSIDESVVEKADLSVIESVYRRLFKDAAGATVYIVGNVNMSELKPMVETYIGALPKGKKAYEYVDRGVRYRNGSHEVPFNVKMETPKVTVLQFYNTDMPATVENQVLLSAMTYILNMKYTDSLREEAGGTYGASVQGSFERKPVENAFVQVFFDTNVDQAEDLENIAVKGFQELAEQGPSDEFFTRTIENMKNQIPQSRISNGYWMNVLNLYYKYGINADVEREAVINALTKEKIQNFTKEFLSSGNFIEMEMRPLAE